MLFALALSAALAQNAFHELDQMCARDHDRLWGRSVCGPTLLVDPKTRAIAANRDVPVAVLPDSIGIANTAVDWNGQRWAMIRLPLPSDPYERRVLLAHESFHRIEDKLGFAPAPEGTTGHLDTLEGRYWLQLEWRALAAALRGDAHGLDDALAFRSERHRLFPDSTPDERALEMYEGLAEYTGTVLAEPDLSKRIPHVLEALKAAEMKPTFVRSFAYASGPAWGALLEMRDKQWTLHLHPTDDLGRLAGIPTHEDLDQRAARYGGPALLAAERERDQKRQATLREFRTRFVDAPTMVLPLYHPQFAFDPDTAVPFPPYGTVYLTLTVRDDWGTLVVTGVGGLIASNWGQLTVPADPSTHQLALKPGWVAVSGARLGDVVVDKQ